MDGKMIYFVVKVFVVFEILVVFKVFCVPGFQVPTFWFTGVRGHLPRTNTYLDNTSCRQEYNP